MQTNITRSKNNCDLESNILKELEQGKTREEIYQKYGYSSVRSMDAFFRRRGFAVKGGKYVKKLTNAGQSPDRTGKNVPFRAQMIAEKFKKEGAYADPVEIAASFGFDDYTEMNAYMCANNMFYNSSEKQYEANFGKNRLPTVARQKLTQASALILPPSQRSQKSGGPSSLDKYLPLLNYLYENESRLKELISSPGQTEAVLSDQAPKRYLIPGPKKVKSIYLSKALSTLINCFSHEKNISIREIVEGAVIEYMIKYGYRPEVEALMSQK